MYCIDIITKDEGSGQPIELQSFNVPDLKTVVGILQYADENCTLNVCTEPGGKSVSLHTINEAFARADIAKRAIGYDRYSTLIQDSLPRVPRRGLCKQVLPSKPRVHIDIGYADWTKERYGDDE